MIDLAADEKLPSEYTVVWRLKSNQLLSGSMMFKAVFVYTINIKCHDDVLDRPWKRFMYRMEKEFCLPFVPVEKSLFMEGDDELCVDYAHYDLIAEKFVVDCGGGLCNDEQEVQEALDHELSKGWTVARRHESR